MRFPDLFPDPATAAPVTLGAQADITYHEVPAGRMLNTPASTGMGYWSVNPYVGCAFGCAYCYARDTHRYAVERRGGAVDPGAAPGAALPPWLAFERRILVKAGVPEALRRSLGSAGRPRGPAPGETVVVGTATDPYQPAERRFRVTRGVLEALAERPGVRVVVITKSPLVTRDVAVLARIAERGVASVHLTITTLDRELARRLEPRAPTPEARLRALARLRAAGVDAGVNVMPVLPGITDAPEGLARLVERIAAAGATFAGACALRLRPTARARYLAVIDAEFPQLAARYRRAYGGGHQVGRRYRDGLARAFARLCAAHGVPLWGRTRDELPESPGDAATAGVGGGAPVRVTVPAPSGQLLLEL
jgi:DNA repair photolyase